MKKIILSILLFYLTSFSYAFSSNCNLNKFKIGNEIDNFENEKKAFFMGEPIKGVNSITLPIEYVCKNSRFNGRLISLFFMQDKIIRIIFQNQISNDRILYDLGNSFYKAGFLKNQKLIDNKEPEQYGTEKNGIYFLYGNFRGINENEGNTLELLEIVDKKYEDVATREALVIEEND